MQRTTFGKSSAATRARRVRDEGLAAMAEEISTLRTTCSTQFEQLNAANAAAKELSSGGADMLATLATRVDELLIA